MTAICIQPKATLDVVSRVSSTADRRPVDTTELAAGLIHVGSFRCPVSRPEFHEHASTRGYCFVFPRRAVWIHQDGQPSFVADANVVPLYNPGRPYRRTPIAGQADRTDWFGVAPELLREMVGALDPRIKDSDEMLFRRTHVTSDAGLYLAQRIVFDRLRIGACDALYIEERGVGLLADVLQAAYGVPYPSVGRRAKHREIAESTRALVAAALDRPLQLSTIARTLCVSTFHLCRVFKAYMGVSIQQYRSQLRLRRSLEMLIEGGRDVLDIAVALGYSSHSHFTRAFRATYGITPSRYRVMRHPGSYGTPANVRSRYAEYSSKV